MIKEPKPLQKEVAINSPGTRTIVEVHKAIAPDQLIDSLARAAAMKKRYGEDELLNVPKSVVQKLTRISYG